MFAKSFENAVRDYFNKNVCPDTKAAYYFSKTRQKIILQNCIGKREMRPISS